MPMPKALFDFLKESPPVAWYPFCEDSHTTGYTPNCSNETDGATLALALTNFSEGEYCGNGLAVFLDGGGTGYIQSSVLSDIQLSGDLTIIISHKILDSPEAATEAATMLSCYATGESLQTNDLYEIIKNSTGKILLKHEYGNGSNIEVTTSQSIPLDSSAHTCAIRRNTTLKTYDISINGSAVTTHSYSTNPAGGALTNLKIPNDIANQADGEYRNVMIFDRALTDDEVGIILSAGNPSADWFDYSNWNSLTGSGYVEYSRQVNFRFTNTSKGSPTVLDLDFGDGSPHASALPVDHEYDLDAIGPPYTVQATLAAARGKDADTITKTIDLAAL